MSSLVACEAATICVARRSDSGISTRSRTKLKNASELSGTIFWLASSWQSMTALIRRGMTSGSIGAIKIRTSTPPRKVQKYQSFLRKPRGRRRFSVAVPMTDRLTGRDEYTAKESPAPCWPARLRMNSSTTYPMPDAFSVSYGSATNPMFICFFPDGRASTIRPKQVPLGERYSGASRAFLSW